MKLPIAAMMCICLVLLAGCDNRKGFEATGYVRSLNNRGQVTDLVMEGDNGELFSFTAENDPAPALWVGLRVHVIVVPVSDCACWKVEKVKRLA